LDEAFQPTPIEDPVAHMRGAVNINGGDLRSELERLPSDLAHYGFELARSHRKWITAKISAKEIEASVWLTVREELEALGEKVTEARVQSRTITDSAVRAAHAELISYEFEREQLRAIHTALLAKRESLTSLVMLARAEMGGASWRDPSSDSDADKDPRG
jgi:hypothetical protein